MQPTPWIHKSNTACPLSPPHILIVFGACKPAIARSEISGPSSSISITTSLSSFSQLASIIKSFIQLCPGLYLSLQWKYNPFFLLSLSLSAFIFLWLLWLVALAHGNSIGRELDTGGLRCAWPRASNNFARPIAIVRVEGRLALISMCISMLSLI